MFCCDTCPNYEDCEKKDELKEDCCPQCPEYKACMGADADSGNKDTDADF